MAFNTVSHSSVTANSFNSKKFSFIKIIYAIQERIIFNF